MSMSDKPLISADEIERRVAGLAREIGADFTGDAELVLVVVLKGALIFAADLMRALDLPVSVEFIQAESYTGKGSTGDVNLLHLPKARLAGKDVLLVEDILDTGRTASELLSWLNSQEPARLLLVTLLDKPAKRIAPISPDYAGFEIPDCFVVGYGLDHDQKHRQLPDIWAL